MGQIVKRKKKGRPSKADLGARDLPDAERDVRRSLRSRRVKYVFDLDDYFDEDEVFADDEDQRRREKKLKFLLKVQSGKQESTGERERRVGYSSEASASSDEDGGKPSKKRKINEEIDEYVDEENDYANEEENYNYEDEEEVRESKRDLREDSPPGTPSECGLPLPDKKALEIILDKLQRKDIYGVYAEPVDPEELPDYHDVIEHPMDFATVRSNLRNGLYATFEQFESDVFLICSNAMQYNAPDTIYHKQARTIQELAKRKFHKVRLNIERDKLIKTEQKTRSGSLSKKQINKPSSRTVQEPLGSDFSSGATLATVGDIQNVASALQAAASEKTVAMDGLVEGSSFLNDNNLDKADDSFLVRGIPSRFGRRSSLVQDENRRATYNISLSQPVASSESIFSTFDEEAKQLMPVGLYADHSYARSLARFAATLGSVAWKIASKRIEQALPQGIKFGQGWVGEYEPLPTPVLMLENCSVKEPPFLKKVKPRNFEKVPTLSDTPKETPVNVPFFQQKLPFLGPAGIRSPASVITTQPIMSMSETRPSFFLSPGIRPSVSHNLSYMNQKSLESDKKVQKQVELNSPRMLNKNSSFSRSSQLEASRSMEYSSKNINFSQSGSFKQPDHSNGVALGGLPNGKVVGNKLRSLSPHEQGQALSDPVQLMRMMADHNQSKNPNQTAADAPQVLTSAPSLSGTDPNNAAMAAARAWMSVGAGGLRPVTENAYPNKNHNYGNNQSQASQIHGEFPYSGMHVRPDKNIAPVHAFVPQGPIPMLVGNQRMVFPPADLSRFQLQSSWRNASPQMHMRQKQESLPPDLNIGFQSSGSPGRPSSGVLVDSQQPDLALQL